jgi:hypothetical protein
MVKVADDGSDGEFVAEGFHFSESMLIVGAVRGGDTVVKAVEGFVGAA